MLSVAILTLGFSSAPSADNTAPACFDLPGVGTSSASKEVRDFISAAYLLPELEDLKNCEDVVVANLCRHEEAKIACCLSCREATVETHETRWIQVNTPAQIAAKIQLQSVLLAAVEKQKHPYLQKSQMVVPSLNDGPTNSEPAHQGKGGGYKPKFVPIARPPGSAPRGFPNWDQKNGVWRDHNGRTEGQTYWEDSCKDGVCNRAQLVNVHGTPPTNSEPAKSRPCFDCSPSRADPARGKGGG